MAFPSVPLTPHLGDLRRWSHSQSVLRAVAAIAITLWVVLALLVAATLTGPAPSASAATALTGTLQLTPGSCAGGRATGTYFRMILPSGGQDGPYMSNADSRCSDQSFTPLSPGVDGGLRVGSYQPIPSPAFAANGDAKANRLTAPAAFYGTSFATATNRVDPQTRTAVPAPRVSVDGSRLTADLRSFSVTWNNQHFNQGAPKPNGSLPGNTRAATGRYDARTGAFTLEWTSQIVGGPFDKFTGKWHFEGRFVPAAGAGGGTDGSDPEDGGTTGGTTGGGTTGGATGGGTTGGDTGTTADPGSVAPGTAVPATATDPVTGEPLAAGEVAAATRETVSKQDWKVSWPVIGLAGGLALLGFGALILLSVAGRRAEGRRPSAEAT